MKGIEVPTGRQNGRTQATFRNELSPYRNRLADYIFTFGSFSVAMSLRGTSATCGTEASQTVSHQLQSGPEFLAGEPAPPPRWGFSTRVAAIQGFHPWLLTVAPLGLTQTLPRHI